MTLRDGLQKRLPAVFGVDLRTLALFRVSLAGVTVYDLLARLGDVRAFYTDFGVMPREWIMGTGETWRLSLHLANGETWFQTTLIGVQALLALMVLLGYRTRLATVLTFVLLGSLHNRAPMILIGGDNLMMCLWFWALFLPWHARFSVDAALSTRAPPTENQHYSWASAGLILQVLSVYFFSAVLKNGADWWPDGTAVWYALSLDRYATPFGLWLRDSFPFLLPPLTYFVYALEWAGPLLALSPWLQVPLRAVVMLLLMAMHVGFLFGLALGHFPFVSLASLTVLLGGWWWDWIEKRHDHGRWIKIYYDRECGFCLKICLLFRHLMILPRCDILPAQHSQRAWALMEAHFTWVVIDGDDVAHTKWNAWVALLRHSLLFGWTWRLASLSIWQKPGAATYDWVARHRGAFGTVTAILLPERAVTFESGRFAQRVAGVFLFLVLAWNLASINAIPQTAGTASWPLFRILRIDQIWNMFAPYPWRDDGWFVVPGLLEDGSEVDILRPGETLSYAKPRYVSQTHETPIRWRTYRNRVWDSKYSQNRLPYARYLCRNWNVVAVAGKHVLSLKLVYMLERSLPPGQVPSIEQRILWRHECVAPASNSPAKLDSDLGEDAAVDEDR